MLHRPVEVATFMVNRDLTVERRLRSNRGRSDKTAFWELPADHVMRD